eukprot:jgi/Botrbrau1/18363/Bobra.0179s0086.3
MMGSAQRTGIGLTILVLLVSGAKTEQVDGRSGRKILKTTSLLASFAGIGNPSNQYVGIGSNVYVGEGLETGASFGTTSNLNGASTVGTFLNINSGPNPGSSDSELSLDTGVVLAGQPLSMHFSSNTLFPTVTTDIPRPAVQYGNVKTEVTGPGHRKLQQNYVLGIGDPAQNYAGVGVKFSNNGPDAVVGQGGTINRDGASVLGEFASLQGPVNPQVEVGYVTNGQPLGLRFGPSKTTTSAGGGLPISAVVVTGISDPAVDYGEINPGRKLQQSGFSVGTTTDVSANSTQPASGNFGSVKLEAATPTALPALTAEIGTIINGSPTNYKFSTADWIPQEIPGLGSIFGRRLREIAARVGRRLFQQLPDPSNPLTVGFGDGQGNYVGTSTQVIQVEGKSGNAQVLLGGSTLNLAAAPTPGNQVIGEFRKFTVSDSPSEGPVLTGEVGAIFGGQPVGVSVSSLNPVPQPVFNISASAVPYHGEPKVPTRKLQQEPIVIGIGDPRIGYIGEGNGVVPQKDGATYTGGATVNLAGLPADHLAGDFRNVKVGVDEATGMPYYKGQVGTVVNGIPGGIGFSSNMPLPSLVDHVELPAVPYGKADVSKSASTQDAAVPNQEAGRKLLQMDAPVVIGVGDPKSNYIGEGNQVKTSDGKVTYSGGITINTEAAPGNQAFGDFRTLEVQPSSGGSLPTVYGEAGAMVAGQPVGVAVSSDNPLPAVVTSVKNPTVPYPTLPAAFTGRKLQSSLSGPSEAATHNSLSMRTLLQRFEWPAQVQPQEPQALPNRDAGLQPDRNSETPGSKSTPSSASETGKDNSTSVPAPIVVGFGNPDTTYVGSGIGVIPGSNPGDPPAGVKVGSTVNVVGSKVGAVMGTWASGEVVMDPATGSPVGKGEAGVVVAGQPLGVAGTTSALPHVVTTISNPAVPYNIAPSTEADQGGRRLLAAPKTQGGARKLLQPSVGGGYFSLGDPKTGNFQGSAVDVYAGQGDSVKGQALGIATGFANNTNGVTLNGVFTDTYVSDRSTQQNPVGGEVGVVANGWQFGIKQQPGQGTTSLILGATRPVVPYNGKPVPVYGRNGEPRPVTDPGTGDTGGWNSTDSGEPGTGSETPPSPDTSDEDSGEPEVGSSGGSSPSAGPPSGPSDSYDSSGEPTTGHSGGSSPGGSQPGPDEKGSGGDGEGSMGAKSGNGSGGNEKTGGEKSADSGSGKGDVPGAGSNPAPDGAK